MSLGVGTLPTMEDARAAAEQFPQMLAEAWYLAQTVLQGDNVSLRGATWTIEMKRKIRWRWYFVYTSPQAGPQKWVTWEKDPVTDEWQSDLSDVEPSWWVGSTDLNYTGETPPPFSLSNALRTIQAIQAYRGEESDPVLSVELGQLPNEPEPKWEIFLLVNGWIPDPYVFGANTGSQTSGPTLAPTMAPVTTPSPMPTTWPTPSPDPRRRICCKCCWCIVRRRMCPNGAQYDE